MYVRSFSIASSKRGMYFEMPMTFVEAAVEGRAVVGRAVEGLVSEDCVTACSASAVNVRPV